MLLFFNKVYYNIIGFEARKKNKHQSSIGFSDLFVSYLHVKNHIVKVFKDYLHTQFFIMFYFK